MGHADTPLHHVHEPSRTSKLCYSSLSSGSRGLNARGSRCGRRRLRTCTCSSTSASTRAALLAARGDGLEDVREADLPRLQPLLEELPLLALERARGRAGDVQSLCRLRELADEEACADDCRVDRSVVLEWCYIGS